MKREIEPALAGDEILSSEEADVAIAAWTLDELDEELGSARWAIGDEPGS